jgi:hypothetical protein
MKQSVKLLKIREYDFFIYPHLLYYIYLIHMYMKLSNTAFDEIFNVM